MSAPRPGSPLGKAQQVLVEDTWALHIRLRLAGIAFALLPQFCGSRLRTLLYRLCGIRIGFGSLVLGTMTLSGRGPVWRRLTIGAECQVTTPFYADLNGSITIGNHVAIAHHVVLVTTTHAMSTSEHRAGTGRTAPIVIGDGCWLCAGAMVMPGVTLGPGSVVAAGAVVTSDVPADTLVGGVPARIIRHLGADGDRARGLDAGETRPETAESALPERANVQ